MNEPNMQFKRVGNYGVLTQHFKDGTWRSVTAPLEAWAVTAYQINAALQERDNVVPLRGKTGGAA